MQINNLRTRVVGSNQGGAIPAYARFLEHCLSPDRRSASDTVVAADGVSAYVSEDLGATWETCRHDLGRIVKSFTLSNGNRLLRVENDDHTYLVDPAFKMIANSLTSANDWHGTWSIDQGRDGVVMYAEYTVATESVSVWRSDDSGLGWSSVLTITTANEAELRARHFHACVHDWENSGTWYVSSGDQPDQCHFWVSADNGLSWRELQPVYEGDLKINPKRLLRYTAASVWKGKIYWVTDDSLGIGRSAFVEGSVEDGVIKCRIVSLLGRNECRSMVSCGDGGFVALSEAKVKDAPGDVYLLSVDGTCRLDLQIENKLEKASALTRSVTSRYTRHGRFFSFDDGGIMGAKNSFVYYQLEDKITEHSLAELAGLNGINPCMHLESAVVRNVPAYQALSPGVCRVCGKKQPTVNDQIPQEQKLRIDGYVVDVKCAFCKSSTRQRVLPDLYGYVGEMCSERVSPDGALKCLAVSAGKYERDLLKSLKYEVTHVSLFDNFDDPEAKTGVDISNMPQIETGAFSLFHAVNVLDYIQDIEKTFREINRVLVDQGCVVIFVQPQRLIDRASGSTVKHTNALRHERTFSALAPGQASGIPDCRHGIGALIFSAAMSNIELSLHGVVDAMSGCSAFMFLGFKKYEK